MNADPYPYQPDARRGDPFYRPGPDWPPSLGEIAARREIEEGLAELDAWLARHDLDEAA